MGVEGIGASVVRKEDRRFITGRGRREIWANLRDPAPFLLMPKRSMNR